jgi:hypothetical protein
MILQIKASDLVAKFQQALNEKWGYIWGKTHEWWTREKQDGYKRAYKDDPDRKMSCEYGDKWIDHYVTDCSGLFSWAFSALGGKMYHGSNTMWNSWCTAKGKLSGGKRSDGKPLKPGTAVFVVNSEGRRSHVGLFIGDGWVIEAQGAKTGVIKSKVNLKKWVEWGELKGVDYSAENGEIPASSGEGDIPSGSALPTLKRGSKGEYVTLLQTMLANQGYDLGKCGVDGDFGSATEKAVKTFQKEHALLIDGIVGKKTWAALEHGTPAQLYSVTILHLTEDQAKELAAKYKDAEIEKEVG